MRDLNFLTLCRGMACLLVCVCASVCVSLFVFVISGERGVAIEIVASVVGGVVYSR